MRTPTIGLATVLVACTGDPLPPFETGGTAAMVGGSLRIVRQYDDHHGPRLQTLVAARDSDPTPALDIELAGTPLDGSCDRIAAIDDRAFLVWCESRDHVVSFRGAPLAADMTIDAATAVDLGSDTVELRRVGDRFLAVHEPAEDLLGSRQLTGSWFRSDGTLERTGDLVATRAFAMTDDPDGRAGIWAVAWQRDFDLVVTRMLPDGTVLDADGIPISDAADLSNAGTLSLAALPGGDVLLIYLTTTGERHALTIARADGGFTDRVIDLPAVPDLVVGDHVLALTRGAETNTDTAIEARILDTGGSLLSGPVSAGSVELGQFSAVATPGGFALVHSYAGAHVSWLDASGNLVAETAAP